MRDSRRGIERRRFAGDSARGPHRLALSGRRPECPGKVHRPRYLTIREKGARRRRARTGA